MRKEAFNKQIGRLRKEFGSDAYSAERVGLIYREVEQFSDRWMLEACDHLIGNAPKNRPPTVQDFCELAIEERERVHRQEKAERARDAAAFMQATFPASERREIMRTIIRRMGGEVNDADWGQFMRALGSASSGMRKVRCRVCCDTGVAFARHIISGEERLWVCYCEIGHKDHRAWPRWQTSLAAEWAPTLGAA